MIYYHLFDNIKSTKIKNTFTSIQRETMQHSKRIIFVLLFLGIVFWINTHFTYVSRFDLSLIIISEIMFCLSIVFWQPNFSIFTKLSIGFVFILSVAISLFYFIGNYFTGEGISYSVLNHLSLNSLEAGIYEISQYHYGLFGLICAYFLCFLIVKRQQVLKNVYISIGCIACSVLSIAAHPGTADIVKLANLMQDKKPDEQLLNFYKNGFISDDKLRQVKQESEHSPNVLLISLP